MTPQQIDSMKLALEALEESKTNNDSMEFHDRKNKAITALEEALKEHAMRETQRLGQEIEQEPCVHAKTPKGCYRVRCQLGDKCVDDEMSFRTTPPQRTWVGLTEQDLDYLCNLAYTGDEEFALAVQAKLMEKNA